MYCYFGDSMNHEFDGGCVQRAIYPFYQLDLSCHYVEKVIRTVKTAVKLAR